MNRIVVTLAALMAFIFILQLPCVRSAASSSGQVFTVDRIEEGIAALCAEDGLCFFVPEYVLGQGFEAGSSLVLGSSFTQNPASERRLRVELKVGDLLDDM